MINRVLIRIKVVQLLYSYLLLEKQFLLESQPSSPTKEKRFAYALYLDYLVLMVRIAEKIEQRGGNKPLLDNRFMSSVLADDKIKSLLSRYRIEDFPFAEALGEIVSKVKESGAYKMYVRDLQAGSGSAARAWREIFNQIITTDSTANILAAKRENYTLRGMERAKDLMNTTFENFSMSQENVGDAVKQLDLSLEKARELYFRLLLLPIELTELREREIDNARHKYITSQEDLNPNMRFVENQFVALLRRNFSIQQYAENHNAYWLPDDERLLNSLLRSIKESDIYKEYMDFPATDFSTDCKFWREIYRHIIFENPDFLETMEEKSVFWNDDLDIIGTFVLKTVKRFETGKEEDAVLPKFKDEEDERFGAELFSFAVRNRDKYREYINRFVNSASWDSERLALMDVVIMITAIAEIVNFPKIPTNVSINEYIEIAKSYSTSKSGTFINGLLGSVVAMLKEEGKIVKD